MCSRQSKNPVLVRVVHELFEFKNHAIIKSLVFTRVGFHYLSLVFRFEEKNPVFENSLSSLASLYLKSDKIPLNGFCTLNGKAHA